MANKKTIIHEFDPCIYPRLLWVVKGGELEEIKDMFDFDLPDDEERGAVTIPVRRKADSRLGYCVWFPKAGDIRNLDWIAHESTHVALCIFNDIGGIISYEGQETFAYLVGWVFGCIDTVRKIKEVKYGDRSIESQSTNEETSQPQKACEATQEDRNG